MPGRFRRKPRSSSAHDPLVRGRIIDRLRDLPPGKTISLLDLHRDLSHLLDDRTVTEIDEIVSALSREGLITARNDKIRLQE